MGGSIVVCKVEWGGCRGRVRQLGEKSRDWEVGWVATSREHDSGMGLRRVQGDNCAMGSGA